MGAAIEVHREFGSGYLEAVYQESLEIEFSKQSVPYQSQCELPIKYKQFTLKKKYCADFVCFGGSSWKSNPLKKLTGRDQAQLLNYLKATGFRVGVLINVGSDDKLDWKRFVR